MEYNKKLDRVMVNITWNCNLNNCQYCWHKQLNGKLHVAAGAYKIHPDKTEREWTKALNMLEPAVFDFVGGEPLIFKGFLNICANLDKKHKFAITTNMNMDSIDEIINNISPEQCLSITGSYHKTSRLPDEEFARRLIKLKDAGFNVSINIVTHPTYTENELSHLKHFFKNKNLKVFLSPYEDPLDVQYLKAPCQLNCNSGLSHYVINNNGDAYRCLSWFRYLVGRNTNLNIMKNILTRLKMKKYKAYLGNIFSGSFKKFNAQKRCDLYCEMKYIVDQSNTMAIDLEIDEQYDD